MVRKIRIAICMFLIIASACSGTAFASSYTVYDGTLSSTYVQYFEDALSNRAFYEKYVIFRSGQYQYVMAVGNLTLSNGKISSEDEVTIYTINVNSSYNSNITYNVTADSAFTLTPDDSLIYSNLGMYPSVESLEVNYEVLTSVLLAVIITMLIIRPLFSFNLRFRK